MTAKYEARAPIVGKCVVLVPECFRLKYPTIGLRDRQPYRVLHIGKNFVQLQTYSKPVLVDIRAITGSSHEFAQGDVVVLKSARRGLSSNPLKIISFSADGLYSLSDCRKFKACELAHFIGDMPELIYLTVHSEVTQQTLF